MANPILGLRTVPPLAIRDVQMFRYFPSKADLFQAAIFSRLKSHFQAFNQEHINGSDDAKDVWTQARIYTAELQAFLTAQAPALISLLVAQSHGAPTIASADAVKQELQAFFNEAATAMAEGDWQDRSGDTATIVRIAFGTLLGCITYRDWLFPDAVKCDPSIDAAIREFVLAGTRPRTDTGPKKR